MTAAKWQPVPAMTREATLCIATSYAAECLRSNIGPQLSFAPWLIQASITAISASVSPVWPWGIRMLG